MTEKEKDFDEIVDEALKNAKLIKFYTMKELSDIINRPWPVQRGWHIERLEARGTIDPYEIYKKR